MSDNNIIKLYDHLKQSKKPIDNVKVEESIENQSELKLHKTNQISDVKIDRPKIDKSNIAISKSGECPGKDFDKLKQDGKHNAPIARIDSAVSIGFPDSSMKSRENQKKTGAISDIGKCDSQKDSIIYNVYALAVICNQHKKIALQPSTDKYYFLPQMKLTHDISFVKLFKDFLKLIITNLHGKASLPEVVDVWRVKHPKTGRFVIRYLFRTTIYPNEQSSEANCCCIDNEKSIWLNLEQLAYSLNPQSYSQNSIKLWGDEPFRVLKSLNSTLCDTVWHENCFDDILSELYENSFVKSLLKLVNFEESDMISLYNEFLVQCFPAESMTFASFMVLCSKLSFQFYDYKYLMLFNCFNINNKYTITFKDLVIGIALMDEYFPNAQLSTPELLAQLNESRFQSFFRFFDTDCNGFMNIDELLNLLKEYVSEIETNYDESIVPELLKTDIDRFNFANELLEEFGERNNITNQLLIGPPQLKTACKSKLNNVYLKKETIPDLINFLHRLPFDVMSFAGNNFAVKRSRANNSFIQQDDIDFIESCQNCANMNFSLSNHLVRLSKVGEILDIVRLEPLSGQACLSFVVDIPEQDIYLLANDILIRLQRFSTEMFHQTFLESEFDNNQEEMLANWFFPNQNDMFESIRLIIQFASDIFSKEKRVVEVRSPCYVYGDIHGNFKDLVQYSHFFWRCSPFFNCGRYLFLGDYVDRGEWGIEVVVFLFCLKILAPNNFFMLRGNHELREVQEQFSFLAECRNRLSLEMWEMFNDCFDRMPIAAIVDNRMYCAHGGMPSSVTSVSQLRDVPNPLDNPLMQSIEVWELLWNDPISKGELALLPDSERLYIESTHGFARNIKRGTAYLYSEEAVNNFLRRNCIDFILRGHEVFQEGYFFHINGLVVTVFSSSKYSNLSNSASVLFVKQNHVRVVRIEYEDD